MDKDALQSFMDAKYDDQVVPIIDATELRGEYSKPYSIGYPIFDEAMLGGVREGNFVTITGIASEGKTSYGQNITVNLSKQNLSCLWFSYEMPINDIYARFKSMGVVKNLLIYTPKQMTTGNMEWIQEKILEGMEKYKTKFIFIDHLDFITPKKQRTVEGERLVIKDICVELKEMAIKLKLIIFLMVHVKKVQGRALEMQDMAESGATYKLADFVFAVGRQNWSTTENLMKVIKYGDLGNVRLLKNRIASPKPIMWFEMKNNIISPLGEREELEEEIEVIDDNDKKRSPLFIERA